MKSHHWVQLRYPGQERFSRPEIIEIDGQDHETALGIAFKVRPAAAEGRYIDEATREEVTEWSKLYG